MKLDVIVPTYKRSPLLRRAIASLIEAPVPETLEVTIIVVDNNSQDDTEEVVREIQSQTTRRLVYIKEPQQGLSYARNAGISHETGGIVGFIDDDEEVHSDWYNVVVREFSDDSTQFIGGPYLPNWAAPAPFWLPAGYHAVIGVIPAKPRSVMGKDFSGILVGGNAVLRRSVFAEVGTYSTKLGRSGKGLLSDEDSEFYQRLVAANIRGVWVPDLIIYHHIPAERLTRQYHRRWCYWRGVSQGYASRPLKEPVPHIFGIPRHRVGRAIRGLALLPLHLITPRGARLAVADELAFWDLLGFVYGKHFIRMDRYYK